MVEKNEVFKMSTTIILHVNLRKISYIYNCFKRLHTFKFDVKITHMMRSGSESIIKA